MEASYFYGFNMTKNGLKYEKKNYTDECEKQNIIKKSHRRTLTIEIEQKTDEYDENNKKDKSLR